MKTIDLHRVWQIMNRIAEREGELNERNIYTYLLGGQSEYSQMSFESFTSYYSFKIDPLHLSVFNIDGIPYEDYDNTDYSYLPLEVLSLSDKKLDGWIDAEIKKQLERLEEQKIEKRENIKKQIQFLQKQLDEESQNKLLNN